MKGIYDWVPWFRELSGKIAEGDPGSLLKRANKVWEGQEKPPLIKDFPLHLDPLSFMYFLTTQGSETFSAVREVFQMTTPLMEADDAWIFPQTMEINPLFLNRRKLDPKPMWNLFHVAHRSGEGEARVDSGLWNAALDNPGVGVPSITQMLCLTNPYSFLALDTKNMEIVRAILRSTDSIKKRIKSGSYAEYASIQVELQRHFPKCHLYEIDRFLYLQHKKPLLTRRPTIFQVSTHVYGDKKGDYWEDFESENAVFTGGPSSGTGQTIFPVAGPKRGDVVLVRTGTKRGRGIGVVVKNDHRDDGWREEGRIHVIWINKEEHSLELSQRQIRSGAFSEVPPSLLDAFQKQYRSSFALIETLTPSDGLVADDGLPTPQPNGSTLEGEDSVNQILYGPPGTGKTWNTVARAVAIVDGKDVKQVEQERDEDPKAVKNRFDRLRDAGQIAMVTFHQNYAYEDFVEGIRPVLSEESETDVDFVLRWGIFRELAETAARSRRASRHHSEHLNVDALVDSFLDSVEAGIEDGREFVLEVPESKYRYPMVEVVHQGHGRIRLRGPNNGRKGLSSLVWRRDYRAYRGKEIRTYRDIRPVQATKTGWHFNARFHYAMLQRLEQYQKSEWNAPASGPAECQNFVLILDEINRGNIARIFGELITLLERSRRIGGDDETWVTLPYSGDEFGVPENLYLIGTMNTADRSIALLDTALRRRFEFVEMMPYSDHPEIGTNIDGVDLRQLLKVMNRRIRFLRDREHQIGHTYFLGVQDLEGLRRVFQKQVLPLLQEYFYDDWAKIRAVLGENEFIEQKNCPGDLAAAGLVDSDAKAYELRGFQEREWKDAGQYRRIYDAKAAAAENADRTAEDAKTDSASG